MTDHVNDYFPPCRELEQPAGHLWAETTGRLTLAQREEWDQAAADAGLYASYDWLSTTAGQDPCLYVMVRRRESGRLLCGLPVYILSDPRDRGTYDLRVMLAGALSPEQRQAAFPMVAVGSRSGYYNSLPVCRSAAEPMAAEALRLALAEAAEIAVREHAASFVLPYLTTGALERVLKCCGSWALDPVFTAAYASLPVDFKSINSYLARFPSRRRRIVARELGWAGQLPPGDSLSTEPLSACLGEVAPLVANVQQRHGHTDTVAEVTGRLRAQVAAWGDDAVVFCYRQSGVLSAAATAIQYSEELYMRAAAIDYDRIAKTPAYFTVGFYQPLAMALRAGIRKLHWGTSAYRPKILRGGLIEPLWTLYGFANRACLTPADARLAATRNTEALFAEVGPVFGRDYVTNFVRQE